MLIAIKLIHTVVWALLAGCILALPITGLRRRFDWTAIIILVECGVLALNAGKCPLTDWAARFTNERAANFDIYLPNWLAQHNKAVFGTLFVVNELIVLWCLIGSTMKQVFKAGMLYFILVFAAGFVLGTIRTLWVVPRLGVRTAELMEAPSCLARPFLQRVGWSGGVRLQLFGYLDLRLGSSRLVWCFWSSLRSCSGFEG